MSMRYPIDNPIVSPGNIPFGDPDSAAKFQRHAGIDYGVKTGTPVYAPASGTVTDFKFGQYQGNVVEIFDGKYYPHMFHLSERKVIAGQKVTEGQLVGYSGATGQGVTGPHVHWGVGMHSYPQIASFDGFINPSVYLNLGGSMQPADYNTANIYAQELLFRDMPQVEWERFHKGKTVVQLFDDFRNALERENKINQWKDNSIELARLKQTDANKKLEQIKGIING